MSAPRHGTPHLESHEVLDFLPSGPGTQGRTERKRAFVLSLMVVLLFALLGRLLWGNLFGLVLSGFAPGSFVAVGLYYLLTAPRVNYQVGPHSLQARIGTDVYQIVLAEARVRRLAFDELLPLGERKIVHIGNRSRITVSAAAEHPAFIIEEKRGHGRYELIVAPVQQQEFLDALIARGAQFEKRTVDEAVLHQLPVR